MVGQNSEAWSEWFDFEFDLFQEIKALVDKKLEGKSRAFKVATYAGIVEDIGTEMRSNIALD